MSRWLAAQATDRPTRSSCQGHEDAKADLKKLVPEGAREAIGHSLLAKRSKSAAVSFDLQDEELAKAPVQ